MEFRYSCWVGIGPGRGPGVTSPTREPARLVLPLVVDALVAVFLCLDVAVALGSHSAVARYFDHGARVHQRLFQTQDISMRRGWLVYGIV